MTKRKLTKEVVEKVLERDGYVCILCGSNRLDPPHHAWHGLEANRGPNRNNPDQLVTLCTDCHYSIHSQGDERKRERCKEYLEEYYS